MYRSSPFRSTLSSKKSPNAKTRPRQKAPKPRKGCVSGSANVPVCGYIYLCILYLYIWAAAFICSVAPVKKIYRVPPLRFNLISQVLALFHHDWSRFPCLDINMFINMMHIKTYRVFGVPPSHFDLVLQVKPTFPQTLLDATSSFHQSK